MTEINLIKVDGKPIEKLIEVISQGIGTLYKPNAIRKEAEAKAYEIEIIERAKSKALAEGKEIDADTFERIQERLIHKELKRQKSIDTVSQIAADQLKHETTVSEEPVNEDWTTRFFNIVEDISDEEMLNLWGRILAGEVKRPKTYSIRTLEFIKNLSKEEATIFNKIGSCALFASGKYFINEEMLKTICNHSLDEILALKELGILNVTELQLQLNKEKGSELFILYGAKGLLIKRVATGADKHLKGTVFTKLGMELLPLIEIQFNENIFIELKKKLSDNTSLEFIIGEKFIVGEKIMLRNTRIF